MRGVGVGAAEPKLAGLSGVEKVTQGLHKFGYLRQKMMTQIEEEEEEEDV